MQKIFENDKPFKSWHPDRPVSKGATAYHDAVANTSWHIDNISELIRIVKKKIRDNDIVVDFGAGTGGSAVYLLRKIDVNFELWLVDNSAAWLGKAYELLHSSPNIKYFLLDKIGERHMTLAEVLGNEIANHVISANTFHLIPNLGDAFRGINDTLKPKGTFTFQSGNIIRNGREEGIMMIDDSVKRVHEIALEIIQNDRKFEKYKKSLNRKIKEEEQQREIVFPGPRHIDEYLAALKNAGFEFDKPAYKLI